MRAFIALLVLLAACGDASAPGDTTPTTLVPPTTTTTPAPDAVVLTVHRGGGLCVDGPCSTTWTVFGNGRVEVDDEPSAVLSETELAALLAVLGEDTAVLPPFTGTCPEAYDGPRWTYTVDDVAVDSCVSDVRGSELVRSVHELLELGTPYP